MKLFKLVVCGISLLVWNGCMRSLILLSPEDHFALGNYYLEETEFNKAENQFEKIRDRYPSSDYATMSQFKLAVARFENKKYDEAALDFELFLEFHPAHKLAPFAQYHLALSKYKSKLIPDRDPTVAHEALEAFNTFIGMYPDHENYADAVKYRDELIDHLLEHDLEAGLVYFRLGIFSSAIPRLQPVADTAHDKQLQSRAAYYLGRCQFHQKAFADAKTSFEKAIGADPDSKWARKSSSWMKKASNEAQ